MTTTETLIPLQLSELFFPLMSLGTLFVAFIAAALVSRRLKGPRYPALFLVMTVAVCYVIFDLGVLVAGGIGGRIGRAMQFSRLMEVAATWFVYVLPRFVRTMLPGTRAEHRVMRALELVGLVVAAVVTVVAFVAPDAFISVTESAADRASYAGMLGRGMEGPLVALRDTVLATMLLASIGLLLDSLRRREVDRSTALLLAGFFLAALFGASAVLANFTGSFYGPFRSFRFSRSGAAFTIFGLAASAAYVSLFVKQADQLDMTNRELSHRRDRLAFLAFHDALTQMLNRAAFTRDLDQRLAPSQHETLLTFLLDLDDFGYIIESFGFAVADHLLVAVGKRLEQIAAATGTSGNAYRTGSDQFALLVPFTTGTVTPSNKAHSISRAILARLSEPFAVDGREVFVTASVGYYEAVPGEDTGDTVTQRLIRALVEAKRERNSARRYSPELHRSVEHTVRLVNRLRQAVRNGDFRLLFQPIVDESRRMVGAEALIRWRTGPNEPPAPGPDLFIPVAEQSGLIAPITDWVVAEACSLLPRFVAADPRFVLHINISARHLRVRTLAPRIAAHLAQQQVEPYHLGVEITETSFMNQTEVVLATLEELDRLGVTLGIDDFGVGFSSMSYLASLPVREIKIDRVFVAGIPDVRENVAIIESIVHLGSRLGKRIIAEGVETEEQFATLRAMGITRFQGYLFSRPVPIDECLSAVARI